MIHTPHGTRRWFLSKNANHRKQLHGKVVHAMGDQNHLWRKSYHDCGPIGDLHDPKVSPLGPKFLVSFSSFTILIWCLLLWFFDLLTQIKSLFSDFGPLSVLIKAPENRGAKSLNKLLFWANKSKIHISRHHMRIVKEKNETKNFGLKGLTLGSWGSPIGPQSW